MKVAQVKNKMEEAGPSSAKRRKVEEGNVRICLGKAWKQWEDQRKICGGTHTQFAEHLLAVHNSCCANYVNATASIMTMTSTIR